jgi:putative ABC transport system ATP-binding protein
LSKPFLEVESLSKSFPRTPGSPPVRALREVTFSASRSEILAIIGPNGSGKTTLLNCLRGELGPDSGMIRVDGSAARSVGLKVVSVHQDPLRNVVGSMTALENLVLAQSDRSRFLAPAATLRYRGDVEAYLKSSGLLERFRRFYNIPAAGLSGGQRQQLAVVMAMMRAPDLLLLDEFLANCDEAVSAEILDWTGAAIRQGGPTALFVTHDRDMAETWADRVLELREGRVVRIGPALGRAPLGPAASPLPR